jgi:hypothetical protein
MPIETPTGFFGTGNSPSLDPAGTAYIQLAGDDFPKDATYLFTHLDVVDKDGKGIDIAAGLYPHHAVFFSSGRFAMNSFLSCNGKSIKIPTIPSVVGTAAERADNQYYVKGSKVNTGFYVPKDDKVIMQIDIVNYKDYDQDVYVIPEIEYIPGKQADFLESDNYIISPSTCDSPLGSMGGTFVKPPPGAKQFTLNGTDMTFDQDGYIVWSRKLFSDS